MASFHTDLVYPDNQDSISGFFKVVAPTLLIVIFAALTYFYYIQNGYEAPVLVLYPAVILSVFLPLLMLYMWYHKNYTKKGEVHLSTDKIGYDWDDPKSHFSYDMKDVKNLKLVYDGYAQTFGGSKGTENRLTFKHGNDHFDINFRLANEEAASNLAKVVKTWYQNGVDFEEVNTAGEKRYLMIYSEKAKDRDLANSGPAIVA